MEQIKQMSTTNKLLFFIVVPLVLHILKILSFIFIPLVAASLIALLFLPTLRYLYKKGIPRWFTIIIVSTFIFLLAFTAFAIFRVSIKELLMVDSAYWIQILDNINQILTPFIKLLSIDLLPDEDNISALLHSSAFTDTVPRNIGKLLQIAKSGATMLLMSVFLLILLLAGTINVQKVMENAIFKRRIPSMRAFVTLEKSIVKFILVKFIISLVTGIAFGLTCMFFDINFPIFWGLLAFMLNFIQMVGSIVVTIVLSLFALAQLNLCATVVIFILILIAIQIVFGSVLEPIFMGKTFSINTITILVMLMLWGYLWGVLGMILSVPITVLLKTTLEQFPRTKYLALMMS